MPHKSAMHCRRPLQRRAFFRPQSHGGAKSTRRPAVIDPIAELYRSLGPIALYLIKRTQAS